MKFAIAVLAGILAAGCASPTVAERDGISRRANSAADRLVPPGVSDILIDARHRVDAGLDSATGFTPPSRGPVAQRRGATIAFVAADLTNGGVATVGRSVVDAATAIGWDVTVLDGKGTVQGRNDALSQAVASQAAGIVLGGFDATEQLAVLRQAADLGIPVVGWHTGETPETDPRTGVSINVTTDPLQVAWLAAAYVVADSAGAAGAVILTDSQYQVAVRKAKAMNDYLGLCGHCAVLSYEDSPIAQADARIPGLISAQLQHHGQRFGYLLGVNGNYFGAAKPALRDAGGTVAGQLELVSAGDGEGAEFQRIRSGDHQAATVAEPMLLQGWQLVDELNRAFAGQPPSGFVTKPVLITRQNVPDTGVFDPPSGYRDVYRKVWNGS